MLQEQPHITSLMRNETQPFEPQAEDILTDEDLLDLFRIVKQVLRKNPDAEKLAKLLFCMSYALGDHVKFSKSCHEDMIVFQDHQSNVHSVRLPSTCCYDKPALKKWIDSSSVSTTSSSLGQLPSVALLTKESADPFSVRPYTPFHTSPLYSPLLPQPIVDVSEVRYTPTSGTVMEPQERGFYYQDGRISREPILLQRYAEQGILTQASLTMKKRKRQPVDTSVEVHSLSIPNKKPKIPHRHGEFESRRDDIIHRMRIITMADLEQKAQRLPLQFTLAIDTSISLGKQPDSVSHDQLAKLLEPSLLILTSHSNMKPHLDNGMNQNGIYYNSDYFRLYLAFEQFQKAFSILFPEQVTQDKDKDRERNANMKAYRPWIEPLLAETNWAAFRRNIVVGERMMQLTQSVGQGVLLMTKELSGSKLHLTFTNSEWDEFMQGLRPELVNEFKQKFATSFWFYANGSLVPSKERQMLIHTFTVEKTMPGCAEE
ncbi:uncharacterized protein B0P05DRAFT_479987 [Gilbertella persicaria]|uniref:uncharacterized protein n=1 Tax=Gilbertella persicaria TaxID=101096 RepID=UPI00221E5652|nr:uncharacterized protein B0P05DRAFT_479987 [Gilbertella persicaria]KAI8051919.1 hypothetical protein B0P05DRAFT_479987 [Gilbertella persicaria]